jgi:phage baseplate assembly protein V
MIVRGVVKLVDATTKLAAIQVETLKDWVLDDVELFEPYGLTARPFADSEAIIVNVGGDPDHPVILCVADRRYRLTSLAEGEVALYDDQGQKVHIKRGEINITTTKDVVIGATGDVTITADGNATVQASGSAEVSAGTTATIDGAAIKLGAAAALGVARLTDPVSVSGMVGGAPVTLTGTITAGSATVTAA